MEALNPVDNAHAVGDFLGRSHLQGKNIILELDIMKQETHFNQSAAQPMIHTSRKSFKVVGNPSDTYTHTHSQTHTCTNAHASNPRKHAHTDQSLRPLFQVTFIALSVKRKALRNACAK